MISGLYLITDNNQDGKLLEKVKAALIGGAKTVLYRAENIHLDEQREMAEKLKKICGGYDAGLMINDLPELALEIDATGVHLGQNDIPVGQARQILGHHKKIGISINSVDQALKAEGHGADYVTIGAIFPTGGNDDSSVVGIDTLSKVRRAVRIPVVAVGGITPEGAYAALNAGADAIAVNSGIMADADPTYAAKEYSLLFNRYRPTPTGHVLTISGSDSSGGTGIQADIKTITLLGSYASSVLTTLAAQNTLGVDATYSIDTHFITQQMTAIFDDIGVDIVKTGILSRGDIVSHVARVIDERSLLAVVDPVLVTKGGAPLLDEQALNTLIWRLLPQSYLLTPNISEVKAITGIEPRSVSEMVEAGRQLQELGARHVLIKGGGLEGDATDLLLLGESEHRLDSPRFETRNIQGAGCTLASAIATFLAQGYPLKLATERAKRFITLAIEHAIPLGSGYGPVNHGKAAMQLLHEETATN